MLFTSRLILTISDIPCRGRVNVFPRRMLQLVKDIPLINKVEILLWLVAKYVYLNYRILP